MSISMSTNTHHSRPHSHKKGHRDSLSYIKVGNDERSIDELETFKKKLNEDDRMDSIFRMGQNLTEKFDNRAYLHPHGMTEHDYRSISDQRRENLEMFKHKTRHENYQYFSEHPEIDGLMAIFFKKLLQAQPGDAVHFAAEFFTKSTAEPYFNKILEEEREKLSRYRVDKMKAASKITTIPIHELKINDSKALQDPCASKMQKNKVKEHDDSLSDPAKIMLLQERTLNWLKKLNIGPLAPDADSRETKAEKVAQLKKSTIAKKKAIYCGCKDPGRREKSHPKKKSVKIDNPPQSEARHSQK